jgi:hypothetical protein
MAVSVWTDDKLTGMAILPKEGRTPYLYDGNSFDASKQVISPSLLDTLLKANTRYGALTGDYYVDDADGIKWYHAKTSGGQYGFILAADFYFESPEAGVNKWLLIGGALAGSLLLYTFAKKRKWKKSG